MKEDGVKKIVRKLLKELGCWQYWPVSNGMGRHGIPDCLGCYKGLFFSIETKRPGIRGKKDRGCSPLQVRELQDIADNGGIAFVCDCREEAEAIIEYIKRQAGDL